MNLSLPTEFDDFIQSLVKQGRFSSAEEAVAAGIRLLQTQESLRQEIAKGARQLDAGEAFDEDEVFAEVKAAISKIESERS
ncbi:type II toxin-antitoxin system ParD family antitoxin [Blastopirellula sp. JC732]|uniref:Type II toxin-antitoxin system ParD family antitoxin n=1 Tax=Blastopirellula sediminis TaxID=2894196 RepID=A0A9X1SI10_9BACT|nr:type II toxin-antitoxin system ParD family antitoxin [Blastopirellula sediminis]MCC9609535.1 type II toxin-antitoxin system ParD family antitoxin [Blastopirellula sediminis]MCC9627689.1 type II toxin-antitoxin system ParD family antitoxin [Blastopirellula sediminis]